MGTATRWHTNTVKPMAKGASTCGATKCQPLSSAQRRNMYCVIVRVIFGSSLYCCYQQASGEPEASGSLLAR
jgi:hypothetical protein